MLLPLDRLLPAFPVAPGEFDAGRPSYFSPVNGKISVGEVDYPTEVPTQVFGIDGDFFIVQIGTDKIAIDLAYAKKLLLSTWRCMIVAPPKILARRKRRLVPLVIMSLIRRSMACMPYRPASETWIGKLRE